VTSPLRSVRRRAARWQRYRAPVLVLGLTGGIGSGKSTVSALLEERGAVVIDADRIVRELQQPGEPVFEAMVEAFGSGIVGADGALDRQAVADIVFADEEKLAILNGIVHPAVGARMAEQLAALAQTDRVVVLDVPLLVEGKGRYETAATIVVDVDPEIAVQRLVEHRGFDRDDALARIARQASREERLAVADVVIDNAGPVEDLRAQVGQLWARIEAGDFAG
jgi:dephospho-CoA kinase